MQIFRAHRHGLHCVSWLDSRHSFALGARDTSRRTGFRALRALHDDRFDPDNGLFTHCLRGMEVISYVVQGEFEHRDSLGHHLELGPGAVLHMSTGTGLTHELFRARSGAPARFLQLWLLPRRSTLSPYCQFRAFDRPTVPGTPRLLLSPEGGDGSLALPADASVWAVALELGQRTPWLVEDGRHGWLHVISGQVVVDGHAVGEGDGVAFTGPRALTLEGTGADAELLMVDLA